MGLLAGRTLFCDKVRLAVTLAGIVSGVSAQKRSDELLGEVAHDAHLSPADMSGGRKQGGLWSGERIMHRESWARPPGRRKCPDRPERNVIIC